MRYTISNGAFTVEDYDFFTPDVTFDCGQCFRFSRSDDGVWSGIASGIFFTVKEDGGKLYITCPSEEALTDTVLPFLALDTDYRAIRKDISGHFAGDETMAKAMKAGEGIRILRQDAWEALASFILSQNNNIPRIKSLVNTICLRYGKDLGNGNYAFPTPQALRDAGVEGLRECRMGFRAGYLYDAACRVCDGRTDLAEIAAMSTDDAREALKQIKGVGDKVAACTMLFGMGKTDAFPIDVWMKRIIDDYYSGHLDPTALGHYAGIAQQYLFYYIRG